MGYSLLHAGRVIVLVVQMHFTFTVSLRLLNSMERARMAHWSKLSLPSVRFPNPSFVVKFVVGSRPCFERIFFGFSSSPLSEKKTISN